MRVLPVLLAALALLAGPATASTHYASSDEAGGNQSGDGGADGAGGASDGTSFPGPEESAQSGPFGNDAGIGWFQTILALFFLALVGGVLLYMRRASRDDRRRGFR